jgi:hypothetical protein
MRPSRQFACEIALAALRSVFPTTLGTTHGLGPRLTTRLTALPLASCVPALGAALRMMPGGLEANLVTTLPTVQP